MVEMNNQRSAIPQDNQPLGERAVAQTQRAIMDNSKAWKEGTAFAAFPSFLSGIGQNARLRTIDAV